MLQPQQAAPTDMPLRLQDYLAKIGFDAEPTPTRSTLDTLARLHPGAIAFENLDPMLGTVVQLDLEALQAKLVDEGRGGYCFEHNLLLAEVLRTIGFSVTMLSARVLWGAPDRVGPRSHMLLRVDLDGEPLIVDAGFGGVTLTGVLRLRGDVEQPTPHEPFRLRAEPEGCHRLEVQLDGHWKPLYRFDQQSQQRIDYEVASWFLCTHPDSSFRRTLMAARAFDDGRHALRDNVWTVYEAGRQSRRTVLDRPDDLADVLTTTFGISVPTSPKLDSLLVDLAGRAAV